MVGVLILVYVMVYIIQDRYMPDNDRHNDGNQKEPLIQDNLWDEQIEINGNLYKNYKTGHYLAESIKVTNESQCRHHRFLVYTCDFQSLCGGLGDRQKGIVSSFLLALLTNRTFIIDMTKPCKLGTILLPNDYDWSMCKNHVNTLPKENFSKYDYVVGNRSFLKHVHDFNFDAKWTTRVVILRFNAYIIDQIREHNKSETRLALLLNTTNEEAIYLVLHTLFKPSQRIMTDAFKLNKTHIHGRHLVCSHIRKGKNPTIPEDNNLPRGTPNESIIFAFLKSYDDYSKYAIYIATDSDEVRAHAKAKILSFININKPIVHVDRLGKHKSSKTGACEGLYTAVFEQFILSLCDTLVLTRSNYGGMAAYLRGNSDNLFLYNQKTHNIVQSNISYVQHVFDFI